ncbi:hypothetical protein OJF2_39760 [Aquisphaera giovannonii]|uniref:DUF4291 domain-containing protein n=1 Tax=Aquisphaera giovannonii TaxID=406548 RepID=A0A5B9W5F0_9BACT|nr:DUF4291 domain-containing protein [Aquisphaera giovannonii]QEH35424.1 hypothetical protein OJF2_39760 [Aquisphaera giovannonii]
MPAEHEIRADFDRDTIVVYQAYAPAIADAAMAAGRFVPPFSVRRMTWIKPSFLWLMHRSNWGLKAGQERILAVRITREGWERALSMATLTSFDRRLFRTPDEWQAQFRAAAVHLQWDTERSLRGAALPYFSIQVGLSRHVIAEYVERWAVSLADLTPRVRAMHDLLRSGQAEKARKLLPPEKVYPLRPDLARRVLIDA